MKLGYITLPGRGQTDLFLADLAQGLSAAGLRLTGTVQTNTERACSHHCDMDLLVLPNGPVIRINQDLGAESTGCRLDAGALESAVAEVSPRLSGADAMIVNKFGKHEAEGRGFRHLMAEALISGLPVVVGVNPINRQAFEEFSEGAAIQLEADVSFILHWMRTIN